MLTVELFYSTDSPKVFSFAIMCKNEKLWIWEAGTKTKMCGILCLKIVNNNFQKLYVFFLICVLSHDGNKVILKENYWFSGPNH